MGNFLRNGENTLTARTTEFASNAIVVLYMEFDSQEARDSFPDDDIRLFLVDESSSEVPSRKSF